MDPAAEIESRDGEGSRLDNNIEASAVLPLGSELFLSAAPTNLLPSEALEDPLKTISEAESSHRPSLGGSSREGSDSLTEPSRSSSSPHLETLLTISSVCNEPSPCSTEEASSLRLADAAPEEKLWQDPCAQAVSHESTSLLKGDLPREEFLSSKSADAITQEQPPYEACPEEDSHYIVQEPELSDDVKREMLSEICKGVSILSCRSEAPGGSCYVYLIGTAHVSEESCREVQAAIHLLKPEVVFLELCQKRTSVLQRTPFVVPTLSDMISTWKQRKTNMLGIVYGWFLAKVAAKLDIRPGAEFRAAYEEALVCGAKVVLGDRDIEVTLRRTWGKMSLWHKTKLISVLLFQSIFLPKADQLNELLEKLKDADILTIAFEELGKFSPTLTETLITERDLFMTAALQKIAEHHLSIVAVVGRGHVAGITKYWGQDIPIHTLLEIPHKRSVLNLRFRTYILILLVAFASLLMYGFQKSRLC